MPTVRDIYEYLNTFAPFSSQEEWDNSGQAAGDPVREVSRVLLSLDVTLRSVSEAEKKGCGLIISHHPVIFSPLKSVTAGTVPYELVRRDISALCCHTPLDMAQGGTNDTLLSLLGLEGRVPENPLLRYCTFEGISAEELSEYISGRLGGAPVRYCDAGRPVKKAAVCTGSGCSLLDELEADTDAFITGDASYHNFLDFRQAGISLFAAGHFETEAPVLVPLAERLRTAFPQVEFIVSDGDNPIKTSKV